MGSARGESRQESGQGQAAMMSREQTDLVKGPCGGEFGACAQNQLEAVAMVCRGPRTSVHR